MSAHIGKVVEVQPLNVVNDANQKVYAMANQIVDPNHCLRDIYGMHCRALTNDSYNYISNYAR